MAERYGGRFSPGTPGRATSALEGRRRSRAGGRVNLLFLLPVPLAIRAFGQDAAGLGLDLAAFGLLIVAAWLTREGLVAEDAYEARTVARRPAIPRKILGALATGGGLALAGLAGPGGIVAPVVFALLGIALHLMSFGLDPMTHKNAPEADDYQSGRVAKAVDEAERYLAEMRDAVAPLGDPAIARRIETFQATARRLFRRVEEDPRDLTAARRWLGVYLLGARDATVKFAALYARNRDADVRRDYEALLDDLESGFAQRSETLLTDDRASLDVEIEVLRDRLAQETTLVPSVRRQRKT